jgi:hypothetical protein
MPANLTDNYVANTYRGVLHVNGEELPDVDRIQVYDGAGNETAIKLGSNSIDCLSLSAQGLTANNFKYPDVPGNSFSVLTQVSDSAEGEVNILELKNIQDVFCGANAGASYNRVSDSVVPVIETQCGLVRSVNDVEITSITKAAGGISVTGSADPSSFISNLAIKDGLVTGVTVRQEQAGILAKGYITFAGSTGNVISAKNLTVSRTGIGRYAIALSPSIQDGTTNYAATVGAIDSGLQPGAGVGATYLDVRTIGIFSETPSGFEVRASRRYNSGISSRRADDADSVQQLAGTALDASGRVTVVVF